MEEIIYQLVFQVTYQTLKPLLAFLHHDSFLYWPFILSTLLIAMLAWRFTRARSDLDPAKPHWKAFFDRYLSRRLWWRASSRLDYRFYFVNAILFPLILGPLLFSTDSIAAALGSLFGMPDAQSAAPSFRAALAYTVLFFIAYDFGRFVAHSLLHDIPWPWQFHKVHHFAEVLTPMTAFRAHPVDLAVMAWVSALTTGIVIWCFHRYANAGIGMITFLGLHTIIWAFNLVGNLRHWQVWLYYGPTPIAG